MFGMHNNSDNDDETRKCVNCRNTVDVKHFKDDGKKCELCRRGGVSHGDLKDRYYSALDTIKELQKAKMNLVMMGIMYKESAKRNNDENDRLREELDELKELRDELEGLRARDQARTAANKAKKVKQRQTAKTKRLDETPCGPICMPRPPAYCE